MGCGIRQGRAKLRAKAAHLGQKPLTVLDLFSGIGGFSLGLERTGGFKTVAFCEIDPFCRAVLKRHWPEVPCYDDIRALTAARLAADGIGSELSHASSIGCDQKREEPANGQQSQQGGQAWGEPMSLSRPVVDVVCGGFPCQDISTAGKGAGITGERSGLWVEMCRIIGEVRPRFAIVENVAALLGRGLGTVLGDLAEIGYDAEWHAIPASYIGAPHRRDRIWIVGYPNGQGEPTRAIDAPLAELRGDVADAQGAGQPHDQGGAASEGLDGLEGALRDGGRGGVSDAYGQSLERLAVAWRERGFWSVEPNVGRVAHGIPRRVDRLRSLGNAVVPQIPELIGRAILEAAA